MRNDWMRSPKFVLGGCSTMVVFLGILIYGVFSFMSSFGKTIQQTSGVTQSYTQALLQDNAQKAYDMVSNQVGSGTWNGHGAYVINNNKSTLIAKNSAKVFASNQIDSKKRPTVADAFLTRQSRQYKNRETTGNGRSAFVPLGWHQASNLPGTYKYAYNRGHLLGYALVGNIKGYDASESNPKNIITQTSWANQAGSKANTGQNYYEGLVRKALDRGKKVRYQVRAYYAGTNLVASGTQIQAKSTDGSLEFNVFVPNAQNNIIINYANGTVSRR